MKKMNLSAKSVHRLQIYPISRFFLMPGSHHRDSGWLAESPDGSPLELEISLPSGAANEFASHHVICKCLT